MIVIYVFLYMKGGPNGYYQPPRPAQYQEELEGGGGLLGKIKGFFEKDDQHQQQSQQQQQQQQQQLVMSLIILLQCGGSHFYLPMNQMYGLKKPHIFYPSAYSPSPISID